MKKRLPRLILNIAVSIFLVALTAEYGGKRLGVIDALEKQSYDWRLARDAAAVSKNENIVIVDIDADSLADVGPWPWSRDVFAQLARKLAEYKPRAVGYALAFPEADNTDTLVLDRVERALRADGDNYNFALQGRVRQLREEFGYDEQFAEALRGGRNIVLGYRFVESGVEGKLGSNKTFVRAGGGDEVSRAVMESAAKQWSFRRGYSGNRPAFLAAVGGAAGNLDITQDADGLVRRVPLFVRYAGRYYASMPLILFARAQEYSVDFPINADVRRSRSLLGVNYVINQFGVGARLSNVNRDGRAYLHFLGPGGKSVDFSTRGDKTFRYVSAADVISGDVPAANLREKIALVGSSSPDLRDIYATPVNPAMPGVELLATQLANLMDGNLLSRGYDTNFYETMFLSVLLAALSFVFAFLGPLFSFFVAAAAAGGWVFFVMQQWADNSVWALVPFLLAVFGLYIFTAISGFAFEWRASRRLQDTFSQYVPPEFAKKMGEAGAKINLEGEGRELTVLFSDVRNFTAISEKLTPHELTVLMNRMLTALTEAIHRHDGTVDKYIGDAVMAFWNAPIFDEQHAKNAVLAALDMQETMGALSDALVKEGFQPIHLGVGLCTGDASVGNMGSALRMTYTAIGDTVNLASRTEGLTKHYRTPVLVTETTYAQCKDDILFRSVDLVQVKGREQPVVLYEPFGAAHLAGSEKQAEVREFEAFRAAYQDGDFGKAAELLAAYAGKYPRDGLAEVYAARLKTLQANPPANWNGVYTHTEK